MQAVMAVPMLVKVLASLALILLVNRLTRRLVVSVAVATVALALWSGHSLGAMGAIAWARFSSADNLMLMVVVVGVIWLSMQMDAAGMMRDLVAAVRCRIPRRAAMAVLPAVIGLLPMPGGALFSAPLVDSCDEDGTVQPRLKSKINYWFRHVWEYWWPLYPGVLLALAITKLEAWQYAALMLPLTGAAVVSGYVFLLRKVHPEEVAAEPAAESAAPAAARKPPLLPLLEPILVVVATYAILRVGYALLVRAWPDAPPLNRYLPMTVGIALAILWLQIRRPLGQSAWRGIVGARKVYVLMAIVAIIRIYGAFVRAELPDGTPVVEQMRLELDAAGIPPMAMIMVLPFIAGLTTGLSIGFVGAAFPVVMTLVGMDAPTGEFFAALVLAHGCGYMGMMLSPVHVCLIVTSEHFKTAVLANLVRLAAPAAGVIAAAVAYHLALRYLWP